MIRFYIVFTFFLLFSVLIVMIGHFLVYRYLVRIFGITSPGVKRPLAVVFAFLSVSFIVSMILVHFFENTVTRWFFHFTGVWHGAMVYLLLAIFTSWLIVFFLKLFNANVPFLNADTVGLVAFLVTLFIVVHSVYNALYINVKSVPVHISHLPAAWQGKKAVQLSDLHLGATLGTHFLSQVVEKTLREKPDIIFITGDLFDGRANDLEIFVPELEKLAAPLGVYYVTGNHETYIGLEKCLAAIEAAGFTALDSRTEEIEGLNVAGIFYPQDRTGQVVLPAEVNKALEGSQVAPTVLLYHEPVQIEEIADSGKVDLMLSGHTHCGQLWPFNLITYLIFKGYDHGFHVIGNFNLYTSCGTGVWGPVMRSGSDSEITVLEF